MTDTSLVASQTPDPTLPERPLNVAAVQARVQRIQQVMSGVMKDGTHFGTIPGTPKPTLFQPGAELLCMTFRVAAQPIAEDLSTPDTIRYRVTCRGINQETGELLGEGIGECSSDEEKYRWRKPVCAQEWEETAEDRRREKWAHGKSGPYKAKQVRTNPPDIANTVLKMAAKRALVAMTRTVLACSDIFAQDLEDVPAEIRDSLVDGQNRASTQPARPSMRRADPPPAVPKAQDPTTPDAGDEPEGLFPEDDQPAAPRSGATSPLLRGLPIKRVPLIDVEGSPVISDPQRKRFYAIAKGKGLENEEMRLWLLEATGYSSDRDIVRAHYEPITIALQDLQV